jgi:hypothetical protein
MPCIWARDVVQILAIAHAQRCSGMCKLVQGHRLVYSQSHCYQPCAAQDVWCPRKPAGDAMPTCTVAAVVGNCQTAAAECA